MKDISHLREEYARMGLNRHELHNDPLKQFDLWFQQAVDAEIAEPNVMNLATATADGSPSIRTVLLKGYDHDGFVFYTNYASSKAAEISANPQVALSFFWIQLERQIRVWGRAEKVPQAQSEAYFLSRPRGSQLGAWASPQSQSVAGRELLETRLEEMTQKYAGGEVPLPDHWGGYRIIPSAYEFWQGRPNRLHDRFHYQLTDDGQWDIQRLAP
ncbi:pyridoxamine 5'-phosphate oxidase [Marinicella sp. W31]|uniref:pyridoxamine 5'-phosphate oxidase n=1 Tax=Marinicella sp. W31 TaxID=3023713 RepID=UPI00375708A0